MYHAAWICSVRHQPPWDNFGLIAADQGAKMSQKPGPAKGPAQHVIKDIRRVTAAAFFSRRQDPHSPGGPVW